ERADDPPALAIATIPVASSAAPSSAAPIARPIGARRCARIHLQRIVALRVVRCHQTPFKIVTTLVARTAIGWAKAATAGFPQDETISGRELIAPLRGDRTVIDEVLAHRSRQTAGHSERGKLRPVRHRDPRHGMPGVVAQDNLLTGAAAKFSGTAGVRPKRLAFDDKAGQRLEDLN